MKRLKRSPRKETPSEAAGAETEAAGPEPGETTWTNPFPDIEMEGTPSLVFQPVVDLSSGSLLGFEALLRWHRPDGEAIPPDVLIPWAEDHGHMNELNAWVLSEACKEAVRWPSELQLAVNCSVFQLQRGTAAMAAATALEESGLNPDRLTVEITESSVANTDAAADLEVMTRLGIQLTVDDVGADWSVLNNLRNCVVNTMKIDASLIDDIATGGKSRTTVETIMKLCRSLGICTVAEAVETADQVDTLREIGVEIAQGYFFSPPLTAAAAFDLASMAPRPRFALAAPVMH